MTETSNHRYGRAFAWCAAATLALGLFGSLWVGVRAGLAVAHLTAAAHAVQDAETDAADPLALASVLPAVQGDTSAARALTSDPIWSLSESLPWIGPQLSAVAVSSAALDDVVTGGLVPLASAASGLSEDALRPKDGAFDVDMIAALEPTAGTASERLRTAAADLSGIDERPLLGPVRDGVSRARDVVGRRRTRPMPSTARPG